MTNAKTTTTPRIEIRTSRDGEYLRLVCEYGERDETPGDVDLDDAGSVQFYAAEQLIGAWGESVDWTSAPVVDLR